MQCRYCRSELKEGGIVCPVCDRYAKSGWRNWIQEGGVLLTLIMVFISVGACSEARNERIKVENIQKRLIDSSKVFCGMIMELVALGDMGLVDAEPMMEQVAEKQIELMKLLGEDSAESEEFVRKLLNEQYKWREPIK